MLYWKWKTEWLYGYRMAVSVLAVSPRDNVLDWELRLPALAQHHERVSCHISLALENINSKLEARFLLNAYCFPTIVKSKNHKWNNHKPSVQLNPDQLKKKKITDITLSDYSIRGQQKSQDGTSSPHIWFMGKPRLACLWLRWVRLQNTLRGTEL